MRVYYLLLAATAFLANSAVVSAKPEDQKQINAVNSLKRHLRSQGFLEWPEELEEFVEHHHHIREIFTRWCLEDHEEKKNNLEDTREDTLEREERNPELAAIYNKYVNPKGDGDARGRKLAIVECNV